MAGDTPQLDFGLSDASEGIVGKALQRFRCRLCGEPLQPPRRLWCSDAHRWEAWDRAHPRLKDDEKAIQKALPGESRVERAFREWIETPTGRLVESEVVRMARQDKADGYRRGEVNWYFGTIRRMTRGLGKDGEGYVVNNSMRSLLVRRVLKRCPDLAGFFEMRELRGRR